MNNIFKKTCKIFVVVIILLTIVGCDKKSNLKGENLENKNECLELAKKIYNDYTSKNSGNSVNNIACKIRESNDNTIYLNVNKNGKEQIVGYENNEYVEYDENSTFDNIQIGNYKIIKIHYEELMYALEKNTLEDGEMTSFIFTADDLK